MTLTLNLNKLALLTCLIAKMVEDDYGKYKIMKYTI